MPPTKKSRVLGSREGSKEMEKEESPSKTSPELVCAYCEREFTTKHGLSYHLNNLVCRTEQRKSEDTNTEAKSAKKRSRESDQSIASSSSTETEEDAGGQARPKATSRRTKRATADSDDESEYSDDDDDADLKEDGVVGVARKRQRKDEPSHCPHCNKIFKSARALDYHEQNFVCRPNERPDGPVQKGRRKLDKNAVPKTKYKRFRGAEEDRTCPDCGVIFSSVLGYQYHQKKKVCQIKKSQDDKPFDVIPPGSRFLTPYGVVEVLVDDRATPTAELPPNMQQLNRKWSKYKVQYRQYFQERATRAGVNSLARRYQFCSLYESRSQDVAANIANIYAQERSKILPPVAPSFRKLQGDPAAPAKSYPERIVACKLVQNRQMTMRDDGTASNQSSFTSAAEMCLYIRRNELTTPFSEGVEEYKCEDCGLSFHSIVGYKYHIRLKVCQTNNEKKRLSMESLLTTTEERARRELVRRNSEPAPLRVAIVPKKKVVDFPMYPQVLLSLGFKILPRSQQPITVSAFRPAGAPRSYKPSIGVVLHETSGESEPLTIAAYAEQQKEIEIQRSVIASASKSSTKEFVHPDTTMKELEWLILTEQSKYLGSMYAGVFKSLKFKPRRLAPKKKTPVHSITNARSFKKKKAPKKRKIKRVVEERPSLALPSLLPNTPLPPFIDMRILVEELSSGRYPSITRQPDDVKRSSKCSSCMKRAGEIQEPLHNCSFCPNTYHWTCARKKYTMKDPEPGDDLLCTRCIGIVQSRRNRAQKRRLEKVIDSDAEAGRSLLANEKEAARAEIRLTTETVQGREYECVASQLRRLNELTELLKDSQIRLSNNLELSRIEATDQGMIYSLERNALF